MKFCCVWPRRRRLPLKSASRNPAFTLIEMLVGMAVLTVIMVVMFSIISESSRILKTTRTSSDSREEARRSFLQISESLKRATLNPYLDYYMGEDRRNDANRQTFVPDSFGRYSDLHFILGKSKDLVGGGDTVGSAVFFQAPLGKTLERDDYGDLDGLLNAVGYYVKYADDSDSTRPSFLPTPTPSTGNRFLLFEYIREPETVPLFAEAADKGWPANDLSWFDAGNAADLAGRSHVIARNVSLLLMRSRSLDASGTEQLSYLYNSREGALGTFSRHQLPDAIDMVLVVLDEASGRRLNEESSGSMPQVIPESLFTDPKNLDSDLKTLEKELGSRNLQFQVISSSIPMAGGRKAIR